MSRLENEIFVCIDCETTGLDVKADKIIEVAAASFTLGNTKESFSSLIDPKCSIPHESTLIHHITDEMVIGMPTIDQVLPKVLEIIGNKIIVGHGVSFDIELLAIAADRAGIPHKLKTNRIIDTLRLARLYGESPINSLEQLRRHFNIEEEGAHRAMNDVIVNMEVFRQLSKNYRSLEHMFEKLSKPIQLRMMPLGKHKGRLIQDLPLQYLLYASKMDFDQDLLFTLRSEIKRRKQGNLFSQATNPFSSL